MKTATILFVVTGLLVGSVIAAATWIPPVIEDIVTSFERELNREATSADYSKLARHASDPMQSAVNAVVWTPEVDQIHASFQRELDHEVIAGATRPGIVTERDPLPPVFRQALLDPPATTGTAISLSENTN